MTERAMQNSWMRIAITVAAGLVLGSGAVAGEEGGGEGAEQGVNWQEWKAGNEVNNTASLQRGAANFVNYCMGCHSLKYMRYQRMADDLHISTQQLQANLIPTGAKPTDYMISNFPAKDAES